MGPFDPAQIQIHDVNPGDLNTPGSPNVWSAGGVFWTGAVSPESVSTAGGNARFHTSARLWDYFDVVNAIFRNGAAPERARAHVGVDWAATGARAHVVNPVGFRARYWATDIATTWSIRTASGYRFSTGGSSSTTVTAGFTATMANGVYA